MTATKNTTMGAAGIITLRDEALALPVILSGVLDAKIAETKAAILELNKRENIVQTLDQADQIKHEAMAAADAAFATAKEQAEKAQATAQQMMNDAAQKVKDADAREKETMTGLAKLTVDRAQFDSWRKEQSGKLTTALAVTDMAKVTNANRAAELDAREARLKDDAAKFNQRLESLKV